MKKAYEWIITTSQGNQYVLTERQYKALQEHDSGLLHFANFAINPAFITDAQKREASEDLIKKYPCKTCGTKGFLLEKDKEGNWKTCPECEGTGMAI